MQEISFEVAEKLPNYAPRAPALPLVDRMRLIASNPGDSWLLVFKAEVQEKLEKKQAENRGRKAARKAQGRDMSPRERERKAFKFKKPA